MHVSNDATYKAHSIYCVRNAKMYGDNTPRIKRLGRSMYNNTASKNSNSDKAVDHRSDTMNKIVESMMKFVIRRLEGNMMRMKHNPDKPLYDTEDEKCRYCGGEIVEVRYSGKLIEVCWKCGKRA